jgi:predicted ATPase
VAEAGAVIGRSFELELLGAVSRLDPEAVDHGLRLLQERYLVVPGADPQGSFDFRHALIRDVLYDDIPLPRRRRLHERVATVAAGRGYRDAFVSAHFEQAGLAGPAHRHALTAAREAAALSAHREALALYRRAQRNLPAGQAPPAVTRYRSRRQPISPWLSSSATRDMPSGYRPGPGRPRFRLRRQRG